MLTPEEEKTVAAKVEAMRPMIEAGIIPMKRCCDCKNVFAQSQMSNTDWGWMCRGCEAEINRQNQGA